MTFPLPKKTSTPRRKYPSQPKARPDGAEDDIVAYRRARGEGE